MKLVWIEGVVMNYAGKRCIPEGFSVTVNLPDTKERTIENKLLELFPKAVTFIFDRIEEI